MTRTGQRFETWDVCVAGAKWPRNAEAVHYDDSSKDFVSPQIASPNMLRRQVPQDQIDSSPIWLLED